MDQKYIRSSWENQIDQIKLYQNQVDQNHVDQIDLTNISFKALKETLLEIFRVLKL